MIIIIIIIIIIIRRRIIIIIIIIIIRRRRRKKVTCKSDLTDTNLDIQKELAIFHRELLEHYLLAFCFFLRIRYYQDLFLFSLARMLP